MRACDLVLSHFGCGTMYAALDNGLPMVNVPIGIEHSRMRPTANGCGSADSRSDDAHRRSHLAGVRKLLADPS
jgi:UDP:flavonoid glycosyltransferase YjiC (YdhE family)